MNHRQFCGNYFESCVLWKEIKKDLMCTHVKVHSAVAFPQNKAACSNRVSENIFTNRILSVM